MFQTLNIILFLAVAIAIPGIINRTRAFLAGRKGIRFFQHLSDARVLLKKGAVYSTTTSPLFRLTPTVYLSAAIMASLFIPMGSLPSPLSFEGDLIAFAYTLALGRVFIILAAMDTGSSFEGMGASREALYGALAEPALLIIGGTFALISGMVSFADIFSQQSPIEMRYTIVLLLAGYVLLKLVFTESGRVPVDDPRTHLELTMIHEVMCLDYTGVDMAMIKIAGWLKTATFSILAADTISIALSLHWGWTAPLAALLSGLSIGVIESAQARNKLVRNTTFILTIVALAALVFFTAYLLHLNIVLE